MRFRRTTVGTTVVSLVACALIGTGATPAGAAPDGGRVPAKPVAEPSRDGAVQVVTDAIGRIGQTQRKDIFAGMKVDPATSTVRLYVTDPAAGQTMAGQGLSRLSSEARATVTVQVATSKYARTQMEASASRVWKDAAAWQASGGPQVYSIVLRSDGSGLEVRTSNPTRAAALAAVAAQSGPATGVAPADIHYVTGDPVQQISRENPDAPYEGGLPIRPDFWAGGWTCTNAFGVRVGSNTYTVTAEHCTDISSTPVSLFEDMNGDAIGFVTALSIANDAALVLANADSQVWVNDDYVQNYRYSAYSWDGEYVCQSGYTSYPNRCAIQVTHEYVQWTSDGKTRYGVEGSQCSTCFTAAEGDSGGPVWSTASDGFLTSRGINSAGWGVVQESGPRVYANLLWTETPAVLGAFNATLLTV